MSLIELAETIDGLVENNHAFIAETEAKATISDLSAANAVALRVLCAALGWPTQLLSAGGDAWVGAAEPEPELGPYRLVVQKPAAPPDTLQLLTSAGFTHWLNVGHDTPKWHIARLTAPLVASGRVIDSWGGVAAPTNSLPTKSPRALVKEFGNIRQVPADIRCWLPSAIEADHYASHAIRVWVRVATAALVCCLPDEIEAESGSLKFRGPPRLTLPRADTVGGSLDQRTFNVLLAATRWVFENEREAEMRHVLLASELARSGKSDENTSLFLQTNLEPAWESAQIAYQMALSETGKDTLKVLSDLRKAITEETAKLSDISRQLTASVAAALATGIGLIAARIAANAPAVLIAVVMLVVALYVALVMVSGIQFMRLQRQLRSEWQDRLYRFLPKAEYERMVVGPTKKAEHSFVWSAWLGGSAVAVLALACWWLLLPLPRQSDMSKEPHAISTRPTSAPSQTNGRAVADPKTGDKRGEFVQPGGRSAATDGPPSK